MVARVVRDDEVAGSNPVTPTQYKNGGMAERPNVTASKTVVRVKPDREFKSPSRRLQDPAHQAGIGGVAERPNAAALKTAVRATGPGVRIPFPPHT